LALGNRFEQRSGAANIGVEIALHSVERLGDTHRRRAMGDYVDIFKRGVYSVAIAHVGDLEFNPLGQVSGATCGMDLRIEVVQDSNGGPRREEVVGQKGSDESGSTRD
jgi:hypothetical protein